MSLESAFYTLITGDGPTAALIGTRCYPETLPQNPTLPAVRYNLVTAGPIGTHDAAGGLVRATVQVDAVAATYAAARTLADTIKAKLNGYRAGSGTIRTALWDNENPAWDDETGQKIVSIDFTVYYQES